MSENYPVSQDHRVLEDKNGGKTITEKLTVEGLGGNVLMTAIATILDPDTGIVVDHLDKRYVVYRTKAGVITVETFLGDSAFKHGSYVQIVDDEQLAG